MKHMDEWSFSSDTYEKGMKQFLETGGPDGDRSGLGIVQIIAGGVQDSSSANSSFFFRTIGENPVGLAKRLGSFDYLGRFENFPATCGNMSLWRSHVIYRNN